MFPRGVFVRLALIFLAIVLQACSKFETLSPSGGNKVSSSSFSMTPPAPTVSPTPSASPTPVVGPTPSPSPTFVVGPGPSPSPTPTVVSDPTQQTAQSIATDQNTSNCTDPDLLGWKCQDAIVTSQLGLQYTVRFKWNRPLQSSRGTVIMANGGAGTGESRKDLPSKMMMDDLSAFDQMRTIEIEFIDEPSAVPGWGGYFRHAGGYRAAGAAFKAAIDYIDSKHLRVGPFTNYLGGSNGSTVPAYAMAHYGLQSYFDRVIFQMGPFLSDINTACDPNSSASFYRNTGDMFNFTISLINAWTSGNQNLSVCSYNTDSMISVLNNGVSSYPKTHIHVIMGNEEATYGFGLFILGSNLEWFNKISAKSKSRIVRQGMSHGNSYRDMRRLAKLAPNQSPEYVEQCLSVVCAPQKEITFNVNWGLRDGLVFKGEKINGRVYGFLENDTYSCIEFDGENTCASAAWTKLPNNDWKYENGVWVGTLDTSLYPSRKYRMHAKDSSGQSASYLLEIRTLGFVVGP